MERIGFIGMGRMGIPISRRIGEKFSLVSVYNRTESKIPEKFKKIAVKSISELVRNSDIIFMIVTDSAASASILKEILETHSGDKKLIVDMSTISVEQSLDNHKICFTSGVEYLDCPVIGSVPAAETGTLAASCGGSREAFLRISPMLKTFTSKQIYAGDAGKGIAMKLVNNLIMGINMIAVSEGLCLARELGIKDDVFTEAVQAGGAALKILDLKAKKLQDGDFSPQFLLAHQYKDLNYALEEQSKLGIPSFLGAISKSIYSMEMSEHGKDDMSAVSLFYTKKKNE